MSGTPAAFTVDLEEWYHGAVAQARETPREPRQIVDASAPLIALLERLGVRATFFTVGEVAQEAPDLIQWIARLGHEIGCHGMTHRSLPALGAQGFRAELDACLSAYRRVLGDGFRPLGFRAPLFSVSARTPWAIPVLRDAGYAYDSSIFPTGTPFYGSPGAPRTPYVPGDANPEVGDEEGQLTEYPLSVAALGPLKVPIAGGVYFRFLPLPLYSALFSRAPSPAIFYIHPWETHAETPRVQELPWWHSRLRHWGYGRALGRIEKLLKQPGIEWQPAAEIVAGLGGRLDR
jgi:polysaccharide deacetylase family protein (PEP-CTERM system associated)